MSSYLVITAVVEEQVAVGSPFHVGVECIGPYNAYSVATRLGAVTIIAGGVGMAAAAAATATALSLSSYDAVLSMGIGGGFDDRAATGDIVVATDVLACDLGADSPDGFQSFGELGLVDTGIATGAPVDDIARRLGARTGRILTVNTVTGTDERALELAARWDPVAEGMEGWGVWSTARARSDVPLYEIRAISNRVGRRDRDSWEIGRALEALSKAAVTLFEEPLT